MRIIVGILALAAMTAEVAVSGQNNSIAGIRSKQVVGAAAVNGKNGVQLGDPAF